MEEEFAKKASSSVKGILVRWLHFSGLAPLFVQSATPSRGFAYKDFHTRARIEDFEKAFAS
jgi:hypothetical protein